MPIIKSARKRVKVAAKANNRNARTKRTLKEALKSFTTALQSGKPEEVSKAQSKVLSAIDTAAKKNVIHKNKAARQKAQIAAKAKAAGVKPAKAVKKAAPKPVAKKAPAKKTASKKPTTKK